MIYLLLFACIPKVFLWFSCDSNMFLLCVMFLGVLFFHVFPSTLYLGQFIGVFMAFLVCSMVVKRVSIVVLCSDRVSLVICVIVSHVVYGFVWLLSCASHITFNVS